jgi:hypothetical protein
VALRKAWLAAGGSEVMAPYIPRVLRAVQETHGAWLDGPGRQLNSLRRAYYQRFGITQPKAMNDEPTLEQILAAGVTEPLDD